MRQSGWYMGIIKRNIKLPPAIRRGDPKIFADLLLKICGIFYKIIVKITVHSPRVPLTKIEKLVSGTRYEVKYPHFPAISKNYFSLIVNARNIFVPSLAGFIIV